MIGEIGLLCLAIALMLALVQGVLPIAGAQRGVPGWVAVAKPAAQGQLLFIAMAYAALTWAFVDNDFTLRVVAQHSNTSLPAVYRIAAVWGGHEGSMLLWILMLGLWGLAVSVFSTRLPAIFAARVLGVMGLLGTGLLAFLLCTSNPFERLLPGPIEGRDLNPLLQDPGMIIHPPMLYMGYVGFSVAFAFAIAALLGGRLDATWARWSRPWTVIAWMFLTLGIAIGSWWAYYELGWGGWWFWDPVENASFLPWLVGTALIHSLATTEKRGAFRSWTVLLAISAFSMSLLGTFLVRSGVLTSVHAFATDPKRGVFILGFLALVIGGSLLLFAVRAPRVGLGAGLNWVSRESMLMANNVLLSVAAASVMLGTLYPLLLDALMLGKISVGPPYFEAVFVPLMSPAIFLMAAAPLARWRAASLPDLARRLRWALATCFAAAGVSAAAGGSAASSFGILLAAWVGAATVVTLSERLRHAPGSWARRIMLLPARVAWGEWGMLLAHFGVGVMIFGVTMVKTWQVESDVRMQPGDVTMAAGYSFRLDSVAEYTGPNYIALRAVVQVERKGSEVARLYPEKRIYRSQSMPMTEAAIDAGWTRDLYVALGESLGEGVWAMRVQVKPFISWIWGGALLMALGGLIAATDRRYRARRTARECSAVTHAVLVQGRPS